MPAYLDHSELTPSDISAFETLLTRYQWEDNLDSAAETELPISGWQLFAASHHLDQRGQLATEAVFRMVPGESGPYAHMRFDAAGRARPIVRREDPHILSATAEADLETFTAAVPDRLPGWTARVQTITDQARLRGALWDQGVLDRAFEGYVLPKAVVLTGPGHAELVAVPRPGARDQLLVGALRPSSGTARLDLDDAEPPRAIAVDRDPIRATAEIRRRFLPRHEQAVWQARVQALRAATAGIQQASDAWDAVSDSFCDADGWPTDEKGYGDGKVARDAAAWDHVQVFLAHGPEVLAGVRTAASGPDYVEGPISEDLRRLRGIDTTLQRAEQIHREWDQVIDLMDVSLPGSRDLYEGRALEIRNAEGWQYANDLMAYQGPALVRTAEYLTDRIGLDRPAPTRRVQAALARSSAGRAGASPALSTAPTPPMTPGTRRSR